MIWHSLPQIGSGKMSLLSHQKEQKKMTEATVSQAGNMDFPTSMQSGITQQVPACKKCHRLNHTWKKVCSCKNNSFEMIPLRIMDTSSIDTCLMPNDSLFTSQGRSTHRLRSPNGSKMKVFDTSLGTYVWSSKPLAPKYPRTLTIHHDCQYADGEYYNEVINPEYPEPIKQCDICSEYVRLRTMRWFWRQGKADVTLCAHCAPPAGYTFRKESKT